jgi:hypothetical protein
VIESTTTGIAKRTGAIITVTTNTAVNTR